MTMIIGVWYVLEMVRIAMGHYNTNCKSGYFPGHIDCNVFWRQVFTLNPEKLLDIWTPCIVGFVALGFSSPDLRIWTLFPDLVLKDTQADFMQMIILQFLR